MQKIITAKKGSAPADNSIKPAVRRFMRYLFLATAPKHCPK